MRLGILCLISASVLSAQPGWFNSSWAYRKVIRVQKSRVFYTDSTPPPFEYDLCQKYDIKGTSCIQLDPDVAAHAQSSFNDVRFTASDGTTLLNRARPKAGSTIFFIGGALNNTNDSVVYMYYGNGGASDQSPAGTYDAATTNVYYGHDLTDGSGNSHTCTVLQGNFASENVTETPVGDAYWFDTSSVLDCPTPTGTTYNSGYTIEAWLKAYTLTGVTGRDGEPLILTAGGGAHWAFGFCYDGCTGGVGFFTDTVATATNFVQPVYNLNNYNPWRDLRGDRWFHIAMTWDGTTVTGYWNGTSAGSAPYTGPPASVGHLRLGGDGFINVDPDCNTSHGCFTGWLADIKLSSTPRSKGWFSTEYQNGWYKNLFYQTGNEETNTTPAPVVALFSGPTNVLGTGDKAQLCWLVQNATSVSIDNGVGSQSQLISGCVTVAPTITTNYTITATNSHGTGTKSFQINAIGSGLYLRLGTLGSGTSFCGYTLSPLTIYACAGEYTGYHVGSIINMWGTCANDTGHLYWANFSNHLLVTGMTDAATMQVANLDTSTITPNAAFYNTCNPKAGRMYMSGGEVALKPMPPTVYGGTFDGPTGYQLRHLGTDSTNGLSALGCDSAGNCGVTLSYITDANVGDKVSVWGTTSTGNLNSDFGPLNGTFTPPPLHEFTIAALTPGGCTSGVNCTGYQFATGDPTNQGTWTSNPTCQGGGGSTRECVVVSLYAISANSTLFSNVGGTGYTYLNNVQCWGCSPAGYICWWDGGTKTCQDDAWLSAGVAAEMQYVNRTNTVLFNGMYYVLTHFWRLNGVNWGVPNVAAVAQQSSLIGFPDHATVPMNWMTIALPILSTADLGTYKNQMLNDSWYANSTTPCNLNNSVAHPRIDGVDGIATGTAQAGTSNSITLASSDTGATCSSPGTSYCGAAVYTYQNFSNLSVGNQAFGYIIAFDSSTKIATIQTPAPANWSNWIAPLTPSGGNFSTYIIVPTVTWNQTTVPGSGGHGGLTGLVTGYLTHFTGLQSGTTSPLRSADAIQPQGQWVYGTDPTFQLAVVNVVDDTHMTVMVNNASWLSQTVPMPLFWYYGWQSGDCGMMWHLSHFITQDGGQNYFPATNTIQGFTEPNMADNKQPTDTTARYGICFALAATDYRAARCAEYWQNFHNDWWMPFDFSARAALLPWSLSYNTQVIRNDQTWVDVLYKYGNGMADNFDLSGSWIVNTTYFYMYDFLPDRYQGDLYKFPVSSDSSFIQINAQNSGDYQWNSQFFYNPKSTLSQQFKFYLNANNLPSGYDYAQRTVATIDPRIQSIDYKGLNHQRAFFFNSKPACQTTTGWTCLPNFNATILFSLGSQTSGSGAWTDRSATMVAFETPSSTNNSYGQSSATGLGISKVGGFLGCDDNGLLQGPSIPTVNCDMPAIPGAPRTSGQIPTNPMYTYASFDRWADFGNSDYNAGDNNNAMVSARANMSTMYTTRIPAAYRYMTHFKKVGSEEVIFDRVYIDVGTNMTATSITDHRHFRQVAGITGHYPPATNPKEGFFYTCGSTSCPGAGGCASLNTNGRVVLVAEDGAASDTNGPARTWNMTAGVMQPFGAPSTDLTMTFDGNTYSGANGFSERVSVCAGSTCGGNAQKLNYLWVYEIEAQPSTTFTLTNINAGSNWMVGQATHQVAAFSADATMLQSSLSFTSTFSGSGQYMIHDLTPGTYNITIGGTPVTGALPVTTGNNTLYFEGNAGAVVVNLGCSITTTSLPNGQVGVPYNQTLGTAGCTGPLTWSITSGVLPPSLTLGSATGLISGTPTTAAVYPFTVQVVDSLSNTASQPLSITITALPPPTGLQHISMTGLIQLTGLIGIW